MQLFYFILFIIDANIHVATYKIALLYNGYKKKYLSSCARLVYIYAVAVANLKIYWVVKYWFFISSKANGVLIFINCMKRADERLEKSLTLESVWKMCQYLACFFFI